MLYKHTIFLILTLPHPYRPPPAGQMCSFYTDLLSEAKKLIRLQKYDNYCEQSTIKNVKQSVVRRNRLLVIL